MDCYVCTVNQAQWRLICIVYICPFIVPAREMQEALFNPTNALRFERTMGLACVLKFLTTFQLYVQCLTWYWTEYD